MFMQRKLFLLYTAMIQVLMSRKYNFVVHLVPIALTRSKSIRKIKFFVSVNKIERSDVIFDEVSRIETMQ